MTSQQFNEPDHPRGQAGRFTEKPQTDPGNVLPAAGNQFDAKDWATVDWTPTDEDPDIVELTGPGALYASVVTVRTEVPSSADYDLPHIVTRFDWMLADSRTGTELAHGSEASMAAAQRAAQQDGQAIADVRTARPEWDWSTADKGYIKDRADAHLGDQVRAYCIGFGIRQALLGATGTVVSTAGPVNATVEFRGPLYNDQGRLVLSEGQVKTGTMPYNLLIRRNDV